MGSLLTEAVLLEPTDDPGSDILMFSVLTEAMLVKPTDDPMLPSH